MALHHHSHSCLDLARFSRETRNTMRDIKQFSRNLSNHSTALGNELNDNRFQDMILFQKWKMIFAGQSDRRNRNNICQNG